MQHVAITDNATPCDMPAYRCRLAGLYHWSMGCIQRVAMHVHDFDDNLRGFATANVDAFTQFAPCLEGTEEAYKNREAQCRHLQALLRLSQPVEILLGVAIPAIEANAINLQVLPGLAKLTLSHAGPVGKTAVLTVVALRLRTLVLEGAKLAQLASRVDGVVGKGAWQAWRARCSSLLSRKEAAAAWNLSRAVGIGCVT